MTDIDAVRSTIAALRWRSCTPEYAAKVGPHEYVVRHKTCSEPAWETLVDAIGSMGKRERYLVTGNVFTYLVLDEHRYWTAPGWEVINRARNVDVVGLYAPPDSPATAEPGDPGVERRFLGVVEVDSGTLIVGDPALLLPDRARAKPGVDYDLVRSLPEGPEGLPLADLPVLLLSGFGGDGAYGVHAEYEGGELLRFVIDLEPLDLDDEP